MFVILTIVNEIEEEKSIVGLGHSKWEYSFPSWLPAFYMRAGAHYH